MNLSMEQRQRIALAKATVKHPKLPILDEVTRELNSYNEVKKLSILRLNNTLRSLLLIVYQRLLILPSLLSWIMEKLLVLEVIIQLQGYIKEYIEPLN